MMNRAIYFRRNEIASSVILVDFSSYDQLQVVIYKTTQISPLASCSFLSLSADLINAPFLTLLINSKADVKLFFLTRYAAWRKTNDQKASRLFLEYSYIFRCSNIYHCLSGLSIKDKVITKDKFLFCIFII